MYALKDFVNTLDMESFEHTVSLLKRSTFIFTLGVGKSSYIAGKVADTLTSVGSSAIHISAEQALHGSLRLFQPGTSLILFSKSGKTQELIAILKHIRYNVNSIVITSNPESELARLAKVVLSYKAEECCGTNFVPTTSTTLSLVIGDALAMALMKYNRFTLEEFAYSHPGGSLGSLTKDSIGVVEFEHT